MNDLEQRFHTLKQQWKRETSHLSSTTQMVEHPAYQEIIRMGKEVVPLILKELQKRPGFWFEALRQITGESPHIPEESYGRLYEIAEIYLQWGKEKGYIQ